MQYKNVFVIAGGWSVSQYDLRGLRARGYVIGVNDSALHADVDLALSMDRLWIEHRHAEMLNRRIPMLLREGAAKSVRYGFDVFECDHTSNMMSKKPRVLNGTNSGMCAINCAFQLEPERVFLLGFDMCRGPNDEPYWYPPYSWAEKGATKPGKYVEWAKQFDGIAKQFEREGIAVFNVTNRSAITSFERISFDQMREICR